jgi:NAD(P)-dependent dehydrogenase (short-subunit alcohol dehydrogenase family)
MKGAQSFADELNKNGKVAVVEAVNVTDWNEQVKAFEAAVSEFGRIDYVYPIAGIGERPWIPPHTDPMSGFVQPDLSVADVDMRGVLYTCSFALQQFRRQESDKNGFRGKRICRIRLLCLAMKRQRGAIWKSAVWPPCADSTAYQPCPYTQQQSSKATPLFFMCVSAHLGTYSVVS